jgi:hypothetical protein
LNSTIGRNTAGNIPGLTANAPVSCYEACYGLN